MSLHRLIFTLFYVSFYWSLKVTFWMIKAMYQLIASTCILVIAMYGWMGLGMAWLVLPNKPGIARSTRTFNRWLGRTLRAIW